MAWFAIIVSKHFTKMFHSNFSNYYTNNICILHQMQQGLWDPAICLNFFDKFLTWLKTCIMLQDNSR